MNKYFLPASNSTVFDMVINTYGDLNYMIKFCLDNNINDVNYLSKVGDKFIYDFNLVKDYELLKQFTDTNVKITTGQPQLRTIFVEDNYINTEELRPITSETDDNLITE